MCTYIFIPSAHIHTRMGTVCLHFHESPKWEEDMYLTGAGRKRKTELNDGYIIIGLQNESSLGIGVVLATKEYKCNTMHCTVETG